MSEQTYLPLRGPEIRLLTIHPELEYGLVSCSLDRFSLKDTTPVYRQFLNSYDSSRKPNRWLISTWSSIQSAKLGRRPNAAESADLLPPPENCSRFIWGDFAALSYAWGSTKQSSIILNGEETVVMGNLELALREFRADGVFSQNYRLWVDALCINQLDLDETAVQVSRMREIYSQAWAVVAWLGPADRNSDQGMRLLRCLAELTDEERDRLPYDLAKNSVLFGDFAFYGLHEFMQRNYWYRLWIIQELVLGSASTILRCGRDSLGWKTFCDGIAALYHGDIWTAKDLFLCDERVKKALAPDPRWITGSIHMVQHNLRPLSEYELKGGERQTMRKLLDLAQSESREQKDKVFGLLGMMEPGIAQRLAGTYSKPTAEIFNITTVAFMEQHGNLEPLREANPWGDVVTPSWVVDWTWEGRIRYSKPENVFIGPYWNPGSPEPQSATMYCADGRRKAQYRFSSNSQLLTCRGFILDTICGLGACERGYFKWQSSSVVSPRNWKSIYHDTAEALYRNLLLGRVSNGEHVSKRHSALLNLPRSFDLAFEQFEDLGWPWMFEQEGYYFRWSGWHDAHGKIRMGDKYLKDYFTDTIPDDASEFDYAEVFLASDRTGMGRRLMFTEKGYMGWAPDNAYGAESDQVEIGDLVCVVFGCSTPLVIRPVGEQYVVLGEAYMEGLMDGEALGFLITGVSAEKDFTFC